MPANSHIQARCPRCASSVGKKERTDPGNSCGADELQQCSNSQRGIPECVSYWRIRYVNLCALAPRPVVHPRRSCPLGCGCTLTGPVQSGRRRVRHVDDAPEPHVRYERGTSMATIDRSVSRGISGPAVTGLRSVLDVLCAELFEAHRALFLLGFLFYGVGFSRRPRSPTPMVSPTIPAHKTTLTLGACLMLLNIVVEKSGSCRAVLSDSCRTTASERCRLPSCTDRRGRPLSGRSASDAVSLSERAADAGSASATGFRASHLLTDANTIAYNVGQATLCFGGVFLCALLFRTRLIPRPLAALGVIGYAVHAVGAVSELSRDPHRFPFYPRWAL